MTPAKRNRAERITQIFDARDVLTCTPVGLTQLLSHLERADWQSPITYNPEPFAACLRTLPAPLLTAVGIHGIARLLETAAISALEAAESPENSP